MESHQFNIFELFGVVALVLLNGFFVAAELALVKIRDTQIETLIQAGNRRAWIVRRLVRILVEAVFMALLGPLFDWLNVQSLPARHTAAILAGFFVNSFLLIVIGELA